MTTIIWWAVVNVIVIIAIVLTPRHTGVNISLGLDKMIESLGLNNDKRKLWSVNNNASNIKVAIRESEHLCGYFCTIHTILCS